MPIGDTYKRQRKKYILKNIVKAPQATYYLMLPDGLPDKKPNYKWFGTTVFEEEFNLMKGGSDGTTSRKTAD